MTRADDAGVRNPAAPAFPPGLASRFVERALAEDLVDVAYATVDSPLGELLVAATRAGLVRVGYENQPRDLVLEELTRVSPRVLEAPSRVDSVRRQLDEYFDGRREWFDLPLDLRLARGFRRAVLEAATRIPFGEVRTYREVAAEAGSSRAVRAAGSALAFNPVPIVVPCHRVVRTDGGLGGYAGGLDRKTFLLELERAGDAPSPP